MAAINEMTYRVTMTPDASLTRPDGSQAVGDDGLTDGERDSYATRYRATVARKTLTAVEKDVIERWLASRGAK